MQRPRGRGTQCILGKKELSREGGENLGKDAQAGKEGDYRGWLSQTE